MKRIANIVIICCYIFFFATGCTEKKQNQLFSFLSSDITGIVFNNTIDETKLPGDALNEFAYMGGGVGVIDVNNDGLKDLFFCGNQVSSKLYLNKGNNKFEDITQSAGVSTSDWISGVSIVDINSDGYDDIYLCSYSNNSGARARNLLFINQHNNTFKEEAVEYGLADTSYSTQAVFFDYDKDGDLDMYLSNYMLNASYSANHLYPKNLSGRSPANDKLYRNDGIKNGHPVFTDVSMKAGIKEDGYGLGVSVSDLNTDGYPDIFVSNDFVSNDDFWLNNKNGTFTNMLDASTKHQSYSSMGCDAADINNDDKIDFASVDMMPEDNERKKQTFFFMNYDRYIEERSLGYSPEFSRNMLQLNNGNYMRGDTSVPFFSEIGQMAGISETDWSWSILFADFNNDGYKDLHITNGIGRDFINADFIQFSQTAASSEQFKKELRDKLVALNHVELPNYLYLNNGDYTFSNITDSSGIKQNSMSNGAAYVDLDNDGDLDLVVNNINQPAFIYQNMSSENDKTNFISIQLKGDKQNTFAVGSKVYVYANGNEQYQEVNPNRGYLSCMPTTLNFGLGNATAIDSIRIIFSDAKTIALQNQKTNQHLKIDEKEATKNYVQPIHQAKKIFANDSNLIHYTRTEFDENDFKRQQLMLFMYSKTGPVMASADINKDGLDDIFISGDGNNPGKIYIQQKDGSFKTVSGLNIGDENTSAISAATFFDANGDGFPDLYIAKGGYSLFEPNTPALQDELYLNDGKGNLSLTQNRLPDVSASSKSCVRACDYDNDGDIDLFVGGRVIPGQYPVSPRSYLLTNDGKGNFTITKTNFDSIGMVTDAQWFDVNNDGRKDLILCGEFMPIMVFINTANGFTDATTTYFPNGNNGFWNTLTIADINGDGKDDIIAGNLGLNSQIHCNPNEPGKMYYADFDGNGNIDPILTCYVQGKSYPYVSRDELNNQIFAMRKRFTSYRDYSNATITDIFTADELAKADTLVVNELHTCLFINQNGKFVKTDLPMKAQFSYISKIIADDFDKDGNKDLLLLGNHSDNRLKLGSIDAGYGILLKGDGKGNFVYVPQTTSGLCIKGDVKSALNINIHQSQYILAGVVGNALQVYKVNDR